MADDCWTYELGQCVSHSTQVMPSIVTGRLPTSSGIEVYSVQSYALHDENRERIILGSALVAVIAGSLPCRSCMLFETNACPGLKLAA